MNIFEITIFSFTIAPSYYWLMYVLGFIYGIWAMKRLWKYSDSQRDAAFFYIFLWVVLGGRIWYMLFYDFSGIIEDPLSILRIWEWGMSFHGGMVWVIIAIYIFSRRYSISFLSSIDDLAPIVPVGIFLGRIGNYLNKELLWFPYEWFLAVKTVEGSFFPSPLLEALLEWIVLYMILNFYMKKPDFIWQVGCLFLIWYWVFRTFVELFVRTPDPHIGYYFGFFTQWSLLSIPMIVIGIIVYLRLSSHSTS